MAHLAEMLQSYINHPEVEERDGVLYVSLDHNKRMHLKNLGSSGAKFMDPTISFDPGTRSSTFFLKSDQSSTYYDLMAEPIVFRVIGKMDKGVKAVYEHWTKAGILHRDGGPAYQSWYIDPTTDRKDWMEMYYFAGVLSRENGPAISVYKNVKEIVHPDKEKRIRQFDLAVLDCRHVPREHDDTDYLPDNGQVRSWPYVDRLTLNRGRQLFVPNGDGMDLREIAAVRAVAKWKIPEDVISGYYPVEMIMPRFHEWWKDGTVEDRMVGSNFTSRWVVIDTKEKRSMPVFMQKQKSVNFPAFDEEFRILVPRMGLIEKPFYEDADVEFNVLTDLSKYIEESQPK